MNRFTITAVTLFVLVLLEFPGVAVAQKYPLELSRSVWKETDLASEIGSLEMEHDHASLILPVLPLEAFMILVYLKEDEKRLDYVDVDDTLAFEGLTEPVALDDLPDKLVYSTRGVLFAIPIGDATWVFRRDESLATDYLDVDAGDRSFMNQVLYKPKSNDRGKWTYGISHLGGIGSDAYIPLLGYAFNGDLVRVNSMLPSYFILQFKLSEHAYILVDETVTAESYRLTEEDPWSGAYLTHLNLISRLEAGLRFADFEIGISCGITHFHTLTFSDKDHDELQKWELSASPVTSLQFQWNL